MSDFLVPVDGLTVADSWQLGPVTLMDPATTRRMVETHPGSRTPHPLTAEEIPRFLDRLEGASAHVKASSFEEAIDLISTALEVVRVFQQSRTIWRTTMFGSPGEVIGRTVSYLALGDSAGVGWSFRGHHPGWTFARKEHEEFLASPGFQLAANGIGKSEMSEGERRAILGIQIASAAILDHRAYMRMLYSIMAAETLLLERSATPQSLRLARRCVYFVCGDQTNELCGRDSPTCPLLGTSSDSRDGRRKLKELRERGNSDVRWRCSEWHRVLDWYDHRSDVVHGGTLEDEQEADRSVFWLVTRLIPSVLGWFATHAADPLGSLDLAIEELPDPPDWKSIIDRNKDSVRDGL